MMCACAAIWSAPEHPWSTIMTIDPSIAKKSEAELFAELGDEILGRGRMGMPVPERQKEEVGRAWFKSNLGKIKETVCGNKLIEDLATGSDTAAFITAAAPLFGFASTTGGTLLVAALVCRIGLRRICDDAWQQVAAK